MIYCLEESEEIAYLRLDDADSNKSQQSIMKTKTDRQDDDGNNDDYKKAVHGQMNPSGRPDEPDEE